MKVTQWFPPDVKPAYKGWYHTSAFGVDPTSHRELESAYNWYWNGSKWVYPLPKENPFHSKVLTAAVQQRYWRGIAKF